MGVSLLFGRSPTLFVRYAKFDPQRVLLGLLADPVSHHVHGRARHHDFVRIRSAVDRQGKGDLALELPMSKRRMQVSGSVYTKGLVKRPGIGEDIFFPGVSSLPLLCARLTISRLTASRMLWGLSKRV